MRSGDASTSVTPSGPTSATKGNARQSSGPERERADGWAGFALLVILMVLGFLTFLI